MEQDKVLIKHYKFIHRNKKVYRLKAPEVVTQGQENTIWIVQGKANLKLSRLEDITWHICVLIELYTKAFITCT